MPATSEWNGVLVLDCEEGSNLWGTGIEGKSWGISSAHHHISPVAYSPGSQWSVRNSGMICLYFWLQSGYSSVHTLVHWDSLWMHCSSLMAWDSRFSNIDVKHAKRIQLGYCQMGLLILTHWSWLLLCCVHHWLSSIASTIRIIDWTLFCLCFLLEITRWFGGPISVVFLRCYSLR
jgi:hypothetical protein